MFNLGNLQDCLSASSWGRAISYFFLLLIYVVMLNLCVTPPLILGLGGPCVQHVDTGGACAPPGAYLGSHLAAWLGQLSEI